MDLHVPVPNIDIAVAMRNLSALEEQRRAAADLLEAASADAAGVGVAGGRISDAALPLTVDDVREALYTGMVATYAQGFSQLETASRVLEFGLQLERAAFVWRGGCIIRSALLQDIRAAFQREPTLPSLLLDPTLSRAAASRRHRLERAVHAGVSAGLPLPGLMAALAYLDTYRARWLPLNLVQAQRDYFGAHSYRRTDLEGVFHTNWLSEGDKP
jgi:6-phosphogluconate dehydrogenase